VTEAGGTLLHAEQDRERLLARLEVQRATVAADHCGLLERAARAFGDGRLPVTVPSASAASADAAGGAHALAVHAEAVATSLADLAASLEAEVARRAGLEASLIEELARAAAG